VTQVQCDAVRAGGSAGCCASVAAAQVSRHETHHVFYQIVVFLAQWQHGCVNGATCTWPSLALLGAAVLLTLGWMTEVQTVLCSSLLPRSSVNKRGSSFIVSVHSLTR